MIKHRELFNSKEGVDGLDRSSETSLVYLLTGSRSIADQRAYIAANNLAPTTLDGLTYKSIRRDRVGPKAYIWEVQYQEADRSEQENKLVVNAESVFSFDTTGATAIVFATASADVTRYPTTPSPLDYQGSINVAEKQVKGTEIVVPALKLTYKKRIPRATITAAYVKTLAGLTGTTNNAQFKVEWAGGELLFLGATGSQGTKTDPEVLFHFAASQNVTGLTIGQLANIAKGGHDYLWVDFEKQADTVGIAPRPKAVYVHKLYKPADWSVMGI